MKSTSMRRPAVGLPAGKTVTWSVWILVGFAPFVLRDIAPANTQAFAVFWLHRKYPFRFHMSYNNGYL